MRTVQPHVFTNSLTGLISTVALLTGLATTSAADARQAPAMVRTKPKIEEIRLEVELFQQAPVDPQTGSTTVNGQTYQGSAPQGWVYAGSGVSIGVPVLVRTTWCDTDFSKIVASGRVDGTEFPQDPAKVFSRIPGTAEATLRFDVPLRLGWCNNVLVRGVYQVQVWDLQVDEAAAARATWPREWPTGMERFLRAEPGVEPTNKTIKSVAEGATRGGPRSVTPYAAAKNAVLAVCSRWRAGSTATSVYGQKGALRGINFSDSAVTASGYGSVPAGLEAGGGTPIELAATTVAALRSINIPSRLVTCLTARSGRSGKTTTKGDPVQFRFICEFYIPDVGWIPYDPLTVRQQSTNQPGGSIKGFANLDDLRECLPLSYNLVPDGYQKADRFAAWGWKQSIASDTERAVSRIGFDSSGRGNGTVPQMPAPVSDEAP